ncbi:MAG: hypothetical protein ACRC7R_03355, partial [Sarcina sp.]
AINEVKGISDLNTGILKITSNSISNLDLNKVDKTVLGDTSKLNTSNKVIVNSINEVYSGLTSTSQITVSTSNYINNILTPTLKNKSDKIDIGDITTLTTINKAIVPAINELKELINSNSQNITINSSSIFNLDVSKADKVHIGDINTLTTVNKVIVPAINEIKNQAMSLATDINTLTNYNIIITNELNNKIDKLTVGDITTLNTTNKTIISAINEVKSIAESNTTNINTASIANLISNKVDTIVIGDITSLTTANKIIVPAINELKESIDKNINSINITTSSVSNLDLNKSNKTDIGDLSKLNTTNKIIVPAINEIKAGLTATSQITVSTINYVNNALGTSLQSKASKIDIGDVTTLTTINKVVVPAINEIKILSDSNIKAININTSSISDLSLNKVDKITIGNITDLNTTNKTIVSAINEVKNIADFNLENVNTSSIANLISNKADKITIGDVTTLTTVNKIVVPAINEIKNIVDSNVKIININSSSISNLSLNKVDNSIVGDITTLNTTNKTLVSAINEVKNIAESNLGTINTPSIADLISNKVDKISIGDVTTLTTVNKIVVPAINELKSTSDNLSNTLNIHSSSISTLDLNKSNKTDIGDLTKLNTTNKIIVPAINEIKAGLTATSQITVSTINYVNNALGTTLQTKANKTDIGDINTLSTTSKVVVGAINEIRVQVNSIANQLSLSSANIKESTPLSNSNWSGSIMNCLGDNLLFGFIPSNYTEITYTLTDELQIILNLSNIYNYSKIGSTICTKSTDSNWDVNKQPMCLNYKLMNDNADIICCLGGINDFLENVPLGTFNDRSTDTFYGALHELYLGLVRKYPTKAVFIMTCLPISYTINKNGVSLLQWTNAQREVAEYYSIPVLDLFKTCGINPLIPEQKSILMPDGMNYTQQGIDILSRKISSFINNTL